MSYGALPVTSRYSERPCKHIALFKIVKHTWHPTSRDQADAIRSNLYGDVQQALAGTRLDHVASGNRFGTDLLKAIQNSVEPKTLPGDQLSTLCNFLAASGIFLQQFDCSTETSNITGFCQ